MTNDTQQQPTRTPRDEAVIEAILGDNINWADADTGSAVDAILTHFQRRPRQVTTLRELNALPAFSVIHIPHLNKTLERLSDGWYQAALENTFTAYETWLPATVLHVGSR